MAAKRAKSIARELSDAKLGDRRLPARLSKMAELLMARPGASLPHAMRDEAGLEAAYRFLNNDAVRSNAILAPHIAGTAARVVAAGGAYCISDSTELRFGGDGRDGLGPLQGGGHGFLAHIGIAVAADGSRLPLGVLGLMTLVRPEEPKGRRGTKKARGAPDSESRKWACVAEGAEEALGGLSWLIHLMDREADIYSLLASFVARRSRFIIRVSRNRNVWEEEEIHKLFDLLETTEEVVSRDVPISTRPRASKQHARRKQRVAKLSFGAKSIVVCRPVDASKDLPESLRLNFVHVFEKNPPDGETPVDWKLVTSEPISTTKDIEAIVDGYRTRWVIEEYNKALKTGCRFEKNQLESLDAILNLLAILMPIAAQILALRSIAELNGSALALGVMSQLQIKALRLMSDVHLPRSLTARAALRAVAALGGHIKNNGPPGWQVLHRGFQDLFRYTEVLKRLENKSI